MRLVETSPNVLLPTSTVKMEDKKRPATLDADAAGPPSKRQATLNGARKAHPDADMPWKEDIDRYQKDAILRQMNEYKREVKTQETHLAELSKRATYHDEHLRVLDIWFDQLLDEIRLRLGEIDAVGYGDSTRENLPSSLFFANHETFSQHLESRSTQITALVSELYRENRSTQTPQIQDLERRITSLLASEKVHLVELERAQGEREQIQSRLESASLRYMRAEKKLDRVRSTIVAKVEGLNSSSTAENKSNHGELSERPGMPSRESTSVAANGNGDGSDALFDADVARMEAVAVTEKVKEHVSKLITENESLVIQLTNLNVKATSLSDEDFSKTDLFKQLKSQHEDVVKRYNDIEAKNSQLREEAEMLQAERMAFKTQVEAEAQTNATDLENQLRRSEANVTRLRSARDDLFAQLAVKAQADDHERKSTIQFQELSKAREERIKALESEAERLRLELSNKPHQAAGEEALESIPVDELRQKYLNLQGQHRMLSAEVQSMGVAFQKVQGVAAKKANETSVIEEKISRLQAEKSKADQKYFATMKAKDHQDVQLKALQLQNQKSSEIVLQLKEVESTTKQLNINLEKQLTESGIQLNETIGQTLQLKQQLTERDISVEGLKSQVTELVNNLQSKDQSLAAARKIQREHEVETETLRTRSAELEKLNRDLKARGGSKGDEESEMLRNFALCTICRSRFKNTALRLCGHVFCRECVDSRTKVRMRSCPTCNKAFGVNDTMAVHL